MIKPALRKYKCISQKSLITKKVNWLKLRVYGAHTVFSQYSVDLLKSITPKDLHEDIDQIDIRLSKLVRYLRDNKWTANEVKKD